MSPSRLVTSAPAPQLEAPAHDEELRAAKIAIRVSMLRFAALDDAWVARAAQESGMGVATIRRALASMIESV